MKTFFALLALVAVAVATTPVKQIYDNTFIQVEIPKGGWYGFAMAVPYMAFQSHATIVINVTLGSVTSAGHYATLYTTNDQAVPTKSFLANFGYGTQAYYAMDLDSFYSCSDVVNGCMVYLYVNATCSSLSGCFSSVTTDISLYGAMPVYRNAAYYYQPFFYPVPGVGLAGSDAFPQLIADYATPPYQTTVLPQYFYVQPNASLTTPVAVFPSAVAYALTFTTRGCPGDFPSNVTCVGSWTQTGTKAVTHTFAALIPTGIQVAVTGQQTVIVNSFSTYSIGLTSGASTLAASFALLLAALLALF